MFLISKIIILFLIILISSFLGIIFSKKYYFRVNELKQIKTILNILENKIKFTYEPIPEIFLQIREKFYGNIKEIINKTVENINKTDIGKSWENSIDSVNSNLLKEDREIIKGLGKLLGKTDVEGQISQFNLINEFLNTQINKAEKNREKGEKLYKKLGFIFGIVVVIILI